MSNIWDNPYGKSSSTTAEWGNITGDISTQTDLQGELNNKIDTSEKAQPNGVATLDGSGKVPQSQLAIDAVTYKGGWDASTNTPTLTSGTGDNGDLYYVTVAGTTSLDGISEWAIGDAAIFNSTLSQWQKLDNSKTQAEVLVDVEKVNNATGWQQSGGTTSKTLIVSEDSTIDQDLSTTADVTHNTFNATNTSIALPLFGGAKGGTATGHVASFVNENTSNTDAALFLENIATDGVALQTSGIIKQNIINGVLSGDPNGEIEKLVKHDANDIFVSSTGDDVNGDGSYYLPYLTITKAESQAISSQDIQISSGQFTENFTLVSKDNIGLKSTGERFYGGSGSHSGNCIIKGDINVSGTSTRFRMAGIQVGSDGVGGHLNVVDTQGRMYFRNCYFSTGVTFSGNSANWFEFHECGYGGNIELFSSGTPNAKTTVTFYNCTFSTGATITCNANIELRFFNCGKISTLNINAGNLFVFSFNTIIADGSNNCINFTSTGNLVLFNGSLLQFGGLTYGKINMTAGAGYIIDNVARDETIDLLSGSRLVFSETSKDIWYQHDGSFYPAATTDVKNALSYVGAQTATKANETDVVKLTGDQSVAGVKTFTDNLRVINGTHDPFSGDQLAYVWTEPVSATVNQTALAVELYAKNTDVGNNSRIYQGVYGSSGTHADDTGGYSGRFVAVQGQINHEGSGTMALCRTNSAVIVSSGGTVTTGYGFYALAAATNGNITDYYGGIVDTPVVSGSGTITNNVGYCVTEREGGTKNVNLLLGTKTIPVGDWSVYSASMKPSYFGGDVTLSQGNSLSFTGHALQTVNLDITSPLTTQYGQLVKVNINATVNDTNAHYGAITTIATDASSTVDYTAILGIGTEATHAGIGTLTQGVGGYSKFSNVNTGTTQFVIRHQAELDNSSTGTVIYDFGYYSPEANNPSGTIFYSAGVVVEERTNATYNTDFLLGTSTPPDANYAIYSESTKASVFFGTVQATSFVGDIAGNASTATALETARNINGVPFNGTANINVNTVSSATFNSSGTGAVSGVTFNGGSPVTVSYNTIGAPSTTGTNATGTWGISVTGSATSVPYTPPANSIYGAATTTSAALTNYNSWNPFGTALGFVNASAPVGGTGSINHPFNTLTAADASSISEFMVAAATYTANLTIDFNRNIKLKAFVSEKAAFTGSNNSVIQSGTLTISSAGDVTIEGFTFTNTVTLNNVAGADEVTFTNCIFNSTIAVTGSSSGVIRFHGCEFNGNVTNSSTNASLQMKFSECQGNLSSGLVSNTDTGLWFIERCSRWLYIDYRGSNLYIDSLQSIAANGANSTTIKFRGTGLAANTGVCSLLGAINVNAGVGTKLDINCNSLASSQTVIRNSGSDIISRTNLIVPTPFV